uniref:Heavy metal-associated isoprenylated plant protein 2-like n=1 Tax=Tanacetum cinerariifolium TaxID=118510 RepID=A0A6L2NJI1_TANCI|nr:heavy metal-associated isoprenylated plant protein 2-like [Tanacetum cinerariifolium]
MNIDYDGELASNTPIGEKIDKIERQIGEGKLRLLDNDGNPLVPTGIVKSDSEVEVVFGETANLRIPMSGKDESDKGYGTNSLLKQWRYSYTDNDDYDPYDDDMYENHDLSEHLQSICDNLDITVKPTLSLFDTNLVLMATTNLVNNEATSSGSSFMNIDYDGELASNTSIGEKIDKIERKIDEGKLRLLDNHGNPLVPTGIVKSDSEVEVVFGKTANLMIPTSGKDESDKGSGTNSLLEQWKDSYPDNDDYDPYDDAWHPESVRQPSLDAFHIVHYTKRIVDFSHEKIEVNVNMHCEKCKTEVLKVVTKLSGINEVSVNLEKQMLVVIGDVDPVCVVKAVRKIGKIANITSVGPPKKPDDKSKTDTCAIFCPPPPPPPCYSGFYPAGVVVGHPQPCDGGTCFIL